MAGSERDLGEQVGQTLDDRLGELSTLGRERDANPFLAELRVPVERPAPDEVADLAARVVRDPAAGS